MQIDMHHCATYAVAGLRRRYMLRELPPERDTMVV